MTKTDKTTFAIAWCGPFGGSIGRDLIERHDLTDAITAACNMLKARKGEHASEAHGFYVYKANQ